MEEGNGVGRKNGTLFPDWKETVNGKEVPLLVLGDPAYTLLSWLMFPTGCGLRKPI